MFLLRILPALLLIAAIFGAVELLYRYRASKMRALALRLGFQYSKGDPHFRYLSKSHRPYPTSFRLRGYPINTIARTWNILEGERNGVRIVILDSVLGRGRGGAYSTFIAVKTDENPFQEKHSREKIAHSNGWTAIYRLRFWQITWTLSIPRIEEHVRNLKIQS